ncbi:MAG: hypothetical protein ACXAC2_11440, partial [Candidatus Kariarchaeaceae archaeon]
MIVKDQNGLLLDHYTDNESITIDVLGSQNIYIDYITSGLTNKTAYIWTLSLNSPADTSIHFPSEITIMDLNPIPKAITITGETFTIIMPSGNIQIKYFQGLTGTRENALALIHKAEADINEAKTHGIIVDDAENLLELAKIEYNSQRYIQAEEYSVQAK